MSLKEVYDNLLTELWKCQRALQIAAEEYYDADPEDTDILEAGEKVSYRDEFIEKIKEGWLKQAKEGL